MISIEVTVFFPKSTTHVQIHVLPPPAQTGWVGVVFFLRKQPETVMFSLDRETQKNLHSISSWIIFQDINTH